MQQYIVFLNQIQVTNVTLPKQDPYSQGRAEGLQKKPFFNYPQNEGIQDNTNHRVESHP
jgi:hypothetical protein